MRYERLLFDLDDTLLDFLASQERARRLIHAKFYSRIAFARFDSTFEEINQALWRRVGAAEDPLQPKGVGRLRFPLPNRSLGVEADAGLVAIEYEQALGLTAEWLPGVRAVIEFLHRRHYVLGIVTNGLVRMQEMKYKRHQLDRWFRCFVISDAVGYSKPDRRIFETALTRISRTERVDVASIDLSSVLMVGDSLSSDGRGANRMGISFCFVNPSGIKETRGVSVQHNIASVADLPTVLGLREEFDAFLSRGCVDTPLIRFSLFPSLSLLGRSRGFSSSALPPVISLLWEEAHRRTSGDSRFETYRRRLQVQLDKSYG